MMYFGPVSGCQKYFRALPGVTVSSSNPADFIIIVASEIGSGTSSCECGLAEMESRARENMRTLYPSFQVTDRDGQDSFGEPSAGSVGSMMQAGWQCVKNNVLADVEDIKKSGVTIRILLIREFLKEIRRWKYWLAASLRSVLIGSLIGEYRGGD
jgi:hypothetical protein